MKTILKLYARIVLAVLPIFFLPIVYDTFGLGKNIFLMASGLVGLILWAIDFLKNKREIILVNKWLKWLVFGLVLGIVSYFLMGFGAQARSLSSLLGMGGLLGLTVWFFLWMQIRDKAEYKKQILWLSISAVLVGLVFIIPNSKLPFIWPEKSPLVSIGQGWSLTGGILGETVLFLFLLIEWAKRVGKKMKEKSDFGSYFVEAMAVVFFGLLTFLGVYKLVKMGWSYLDIKSAWVIAVETLKTKALFGVGLGNFLEAFSRFRPASYNMTNLWSSTMMISSMGILQVWAELGLVGLVTLILVVLSVIKRRKVNGWGEVFLLGLLALLLPPTFLVIFLLFWVMASNFDDTKEVKVILPLGENGFNILPYLLSLVILGVSGFGVYKITRATVADYYYRQSLLAASKNDGAGAYNNQIKTIKMNPNLADYRAVYAQTNLALASNFLSVGTGETVSTENKEKASTLIQQAVREAQAAVNLDSNLGAYWANLGAIYQSLIGVVDSALDWSMQSYQQAAQIDPVNPTYNMTMGSLMYGSQNYALAERYFEETIVDKNNFANAWYNRAYAAKQQDKLPDAVKYMQQALNLVTVDSEDYTKAKKDLDDWQKQLDETIAQYQEQLKKEQTEQEKTDTMKTETLKTAQPLPTMGTEDKVDVSEKQLEPKITVVPTGSPTVSPTE
jgi:tetratricopeptide (TPR) repeat protein